MEELNIEYAVLNILLKNKNKQAFIFENTMSVFFDDMLNRTIYDLSLKMHNNCEEIDPVIIANVAKNSKISFRISEILLDNFAMSSLVDKYCKELFNTYIEKLIKQAKNQSDLRNIIELQNSFTFSEDRILHISDGVENFEKKYELKKEKAVFTLYENLDDCVGSFLGGDYIVLGGGTGTGKTSIALNIAKQLCLQDKHTLYFSLEMPLEQLQNRFVCMLQGLSANKYRSFGFNLVEMQKYKEGLAYLNQWNLNVVKDYNLTTDKMKTYIEKQKNKNLDFVIIDYLGLLQGYNNKSLYEKMTILSRQIKIMATEFNIPILVLVQLNRNLKDRNNKRPILSDIRESGAIEQDADFIMFAHREGIYDQNISPEALELIIAKNRHGTSNKILNFNFNLTSQLITEK